MLFKSERPLYHGDVFVYGYQLFQKDMTQKLSECSVHHPNANAIKHYVGRHTCAIHAEWYMLVEIPGKQFCITHSCECITFDVAGLINSGDLFWEYWSGTRGCP
jgi:hypothetical protein